MLVLVPKAAVTTSGLLKTTEKKFSYGSEGQNFHISFTGSNQGVGKAAFPPETLGEVVAVSLQPLSLWSCCFFLFFSRHISLCLLHKSPGEGI